MSEPLSAPAALDPYTAEAFRQVEADLMGRWPENRPGPSLERIALLCDLIGHPERSAPVVHVTGTNGKTSTARMIDALLRSIGLRTGRFTSPHTEDIRERIAIDGLPISVDGFIGAWADVASMVDVVDERSDIRMTFFETLTGMAFAAFADAPVDVAVLEVGLGGSWDATNVADAQVAVIMPVDLDHTRLLGSTPVEIAREKAGIIKPGSTAIIARQSPEVLEVIAERCAEVGALMKVAGRDFGLLERALAVGGQVLRLQGLRDVYDEVILPLHGEHQAENAAVALAAVEAFIGSGGPAPTIDADVIREGFAMADSPARLEVLRTAPTIIIDAAHNPHGARATAAALTETFAFDRLIGVFACSQEKDVAGILEAFDPIVDKVVVSENSTTRTMPIAELAEIAASVFGEDRVIVEPILEDALMRAVELAEEDGIAGGAGIIVTGSVYTAGQARVLLGTGPRP